MGKLIVMPSRNATTTNHPASQAQEQPNALVEGTPLSDIDFSVWANAPRERTAAYFPTYSAVSKAMQTAMRQWVREWFSENLEVLQRPHITYSLLVYQCTIPFAGRPTNIFTYEIQQTDTLHKAFRSAAIRLRRFLKNMDAKHQDWFTREHYFAYRSKEVVNYVHKNPRALYRMLHVETLLMDAILRFSITDLPTLGLEASLIRLRRTFRVQLHRFSEQFDLSPRSEELLRIATDALVTKMNKDIAVPLPKVA